MGVDLTDWYVRAVASQQPDDLDMGMAGEEADELGPDVAGRTDDRDAQACLRNAVDPVLRLRGRDAAGAHGRTTPLTGGCSGVGVPKTNWSMGA